MAAGDVIRLLALVVFVRLDSALGQVGGWRTGRGTFYGNEPWLWDIHK